MKIRELIYTGILILALLLIAGTASAVGQLLCHGSHVQDCYRGPSTPITHVDEWNVCREVNNQTGKGDVFIPTDTSLQWEKLWTSSTTVRANPLPPGLTLALCASNDICPEENLTVSGAAWASTQFPGDAQAQAKNGARLRLRQAIIDSGWDQTTINNALIVYESVSFNHSAGGTMTVGGQTFTWSSELEYNEDTSFGVGTWYAAAYLTAPPGTLCPNLPHDTTPPVISGVGASTLSTTANIVWSTDEISTSQVEYGLTTSYGNQSSLNNGFSTYHPVSLSYLNPSTTYHYRAKSSDPTGNLGQSGDHTFITKSANYYVAHGFATNKGTSAGAISTAKTSVTGVINSAPPWNSQTRQNAVSIVNMLDANNPTYWSSVDEQRTGSITVGGQQFDWLTTLTAEETESGGGGTGVRWSATIDIAGPN